MSSVSSLGSQASTAGAATPQQSLDNQIQALEKRIKDAAANGVIGQDQATALTKQLDEIQKSFDSAATSGNVSPSDYRQIQRQLHQIGRTLLQANQATMNASMAQAAMQGLTDGANQVDPLTGAPIQAPGTDPQTGASTDTNWWGGVNLTV